MSYACDIGHHHHHHNNNLSNHVHKYIIYKQSLLSHVKLGMIYACVSQQECERKNFGYFKWRSILEFSGFVVFRELPICQPINILCIVYLTLPRSRASIRHSRIHSVKFIHHLMPDLSPRKWMRVREWMHIHIWCVREYECLLIIFQSFFFGHLDVCGNK